MHPKRPLQQALQLYQERFRLLVPLVRLLLAADLASSKSLMTAAM